MANQHFCLRWNNHQSTLVSVFDSLLESGTLVDCTLAAEGRCIQAHKVLLSACSPYFAVSCIFANFANLPILKYAAQLSKLNSSFMSRVVLYSSDLMF